MNIARFIAGFVAVAALGSATIAQAETIVAPRGTQIYAVVEQRLSSKTNHDGDPVTLLLKDGFFHKNNVALEGATIDGHIEHDTAAGPTHKATMNIVFDDIKLADGHSLPMAAQVRSVKILEPHTHHIRDAGFIIGGAVVGHAMGGHHGVKHGGLGGAAAGFALASAMKSDIVVRRNSQVTLRLTQDLAQ